MKKQEIQDTGRLMPQAVNFEEVILGAILIEKKAFEMASNILTEEMFYNHSNKLIYKACNYLDSERKPIDLLTVVERLRSEGNLEEVGGVLYIVNLSQKVLSSAHLEEHCMVVQEKYIRRKAIEFSLAATNSFFDESQNSEDTLSELNRQIESIMEETSGSDETVSLYKSAKQSIVDMLNRISEIKEGRNTGITTGFADLDRLITGWNPEKLIILSARPALGKTSLAIHFAIKAAKSGHKVLFFSLEMGHKELSSRIIIGCSDVDSWKYNSGYLQYEESERAIKTSENLRLPIEISDAPNMTIRKIVSKSRLLKKQGKCDMVIIDYLQLITPESRANRNREQEVSEMSRMLKLAAKELKVPFIVLCQMNREFDKEKNREPRLSDIRESGSIEQDADIVIFLHKPDKEENQIDLHIKKHRAGRIGKVTVRHNDSMTSFYDLDSEDISRLIPRRESCMPF